MTFLPDKMEKLNTESIQEYINRLYDYYQTEMKGQDFSYNGLFIYHQTQPALDGKEGGFWHIITKEYYDEYNNPVTLPCTAKNGIPICLHVCRLFQVYDPWRTQQIHYPDGAPAPARYLCLNRCERINWIKPILKEAERNPGSMKIWDKLHKSNTIRRHIWFEQESYIVILSKWKNETVYKFVSSFVTDYNNIRRRYEKEYQRYIRNGNQPIV